MENRPGWHQSDPAALIDLRTTHPDIMALKALAFYDLLDGDPKALDGAIGCELEDGPYEEAVAFSLVRHSIGLFPTAQQVAA